MAGTVFDFSDTPDTAYGWDGSFLPGVPIAHMTHFCDETPKISGVGWFMQAEREGAHVWVSLPAHLA